MEGPKTFGPAVIGEHTRETEQRSHADRYDRDHADQRHRDDDNEHSCPNS